MSAYCIYKVIFLKKKWKDFICETLDASSRTADSTYEWRVLLRKAGNWCDKRTKVPQQTTQNYLASGNWSEVLSLLLRKKSWIWSRLQNWRNCTRCNLGSWRKNGTNSRSRWLPHWSILEDLGTPENSMKFNEESSHTIHALGNIELHELGQISRTVQRHSCMKHILEGLTLCSCGICLRPDEETMQRTKARFQAMTVPYYFARVNHSRSKKHGEAQWQRDHWKATDARRGAWKHKEDSIVIRWQEDEKYRNSLQAHGWTEEYCRHLHCLTTIDISHTAPWHQRHRYESTITLVCNDDDRRWEHEKIPNPLRKCSQIFDKKKGERIPLFRRTRE